MARSKEVTIDRMPRRIIAQDPTSDYLAWIKVDGAFVKLQIGHQFSQEDADAIVEYAVVGIARGRKS